MQRQRLEGWIVKQIEHADHTKEAIIQGDSPTKGTQDQQPSFNPQNSPKAAKARHDFKRHIGIPSGDRYGDDVGLVSPVSPSPSPRSSAPSPRTFTHRKRVLVSESKGKAISSEWQQRVHASACDVVEEEEGKIDRKKILKDTRQEETKGAQLITSPLMTWGLQRELILEYIRQTVLPVSWSMDVKFAGEWEAARIELSKQQQEEEANTNGNAALLALLPQLEDKNKSKKAHKNNYDRSKHLSSCPTGSTSNGSEPPSSSSPRGRHHSASQRQQRVSRAEERIHKLLSELRADPLLWQTFQQQVEKYQETKKLQQLDKIEQNKSLQGMSNKEERQRQKCQQNHEKHVKNRHRYEQIQHFYQDQLDDYERKHMEMQGLFKGPKISQRGRELQKQLIKKKQQKWLFLIYFLTTTNHFRGVLHVKKQQLFFEKKQFKAACLIQKVCKQWKWVRCTKHTLVIMQWLRKMLWKLLLKIRIKRKNQMVNLLKNFLIENLTNSSRETKNFTRIMFKWRQKVIFSQKYAINFILCTRARLYTLSLWFDQVDHERCRLEKMNHIPPRESREGEWNATVHRKSFTGSNSNAAVRRQFLAVGAMTSDGSTTINTSTTGGRSGSISGNSSGGGGTSTGGSGGGGGASAGYLSVHRKSGLHLMEEQLTTMQQVLTPVELLRVQQQAFHIVKIPRAIKMKVLLDYLRQCRKEYIRKYCLYEDRINCTILTREVKLDDARAIVQHGASWGSILMDHHKQSMVMIQKPIFKIYSHDKKKIMEELVKKAIQMTLDKDPEQKAIAERQKQQRYILEHAGAGAPRAGAAATTTTTAASNNSGTHIATSTTTTGMTGTTGMKRRESHIGALSFLDASTTLSGASDTAIVSGLSGEGVEAGQAGSNKQRPSRRLTFFLPSTDEAQAKSSSLSPLSTPSPPPTTTTTSINTPRKISMN